MGTENLSIPEIGHIAMQKGMNVSEVMAMPELDSYLYDGQSMMICSGLVVRLWKAGGLFEGFEINAQEFTPLDVY